MFDLDHDDPLKLSNIVGETVVSCWSMEDVIAATYNAPGMKIESSVSLPGID